MRIIARSRIREFYERAGCHDAQQPLLSWYAEAKAATWKNPADIKAQYRHASIVGNNRAVFNIAGNKYRLVVKFHYNTGIAYIRFIGTHKEYDKINAEEI
ncbi:MAG: type II toxin-antitoxin system HigB family toxin [Bacteroidota bacterium]